MVKTLVDKLKAEGIPMALCGDPVGKFQDEYPDEFAFIAHKLKTTQNKFLGDCLTAIKTHGELSRKQMNAVREGAGRWMQRSDPEAQIQAVNYAQVNDKSNRELYEWLYHNRQSPEAMNMLENLVEYGNLTDKQKQRTRRLRSCYHRY